MKQPNLLAGVDWSDWSKPYVPFVPSSETSKAAAKTVDREKVATIREHMYRAIRDSRDGLTDDDLQAQFALSGDTERPRRIELATAGRIQDSGRKRATRRGRQAVVWVITEA